MLNEIFITKSLHYILTFALISGIGAKRFKQKVKTFRPGKKKFFHQIFISKDKKMMVYIYIYIQGDIYIYIQGVPGGMDKTSGECSLC